MSEPCRKPMRVYDDCPFCPFCAAPGPALTGDPGGMQRNWSCQECGEQWRMKRGKPPQEAQP